MKKATLLLLVISSLALPALAAGGGGGGHHEPHVANWWGALSEVNAHAPALGWLTITFGLFLAIVYKALRRPLTNYLEARSDEVKNALEEARQARADAEAKARAYEDRLANLGAEIDALKSEFKSRGEAELRRLEQAGQAAAARIAKDAEDTIGAETERAQQALKNEAARLSLQLAADTLKTAIETSDHSRLEQAFLRDMAH
ncbi:MAG: hypothetical protein ACO3JL_01180 [Myxococcota bacterium]